MTQSELMSSWEDITKDAEEARSEWGVILRALKKLGFEGLLVSPTVLDIGGVEMNFQNI